MSTFVTVGNARQSFSRLLQAVIAVIDVLPKPILVQHGHTDFTHPDCVSARFVDRGEFELAVRADIVITHAGAGSVLQSLWAGRMPIVMPRLKRLGEHVDDHQVDLANALARLGRVVRIDDADSLRRAVLALPASPRTPWAAVGGEPGPVAAVRRAIQEGRK